MALTERMIARQVWQYCCNLHKIVCWHTPNEGKRSYFTAADLKSQGLLPGVADFVFLWAGGCGCIELKTPAAYRRKNHGLSDAQLEFKEWCEECGVPYEIADSLEAVQAILKKWKTL